MAAIKHHEGTKRFTLKKVIRELEKIQRIHLKDGSHHTLPLTSTQKTILEALPIDKNPFS